MAAKIHLSRRYIGWKGKTTGGDLCKYRVFEVMGTGRKKGERTFLSQCYILTATPMSYTNNPVVLRVFKGKTLICIEEAHTADSWLMISFAVRKLMENKNNDVR